jgi:glycosyltransferase involved in cell wall biosynthesis
MEFTFLSVKKLRKILLITNIPNPYRIPLFRLMNEEFHAKGIQFRVVFGAKGYKGRRFELDSSELKFDHLILRSQKIPFKHEGFIFTYRGIIREILSFKPDKIVVLGYSIATVKIWILSFFIKIKYLIWAGTISTSQQAKSKLRTLFRKMLVRRAFGFIAYGSSAKEYFKHLGAHEAKIHIAINTVDTNYFKVETERLRLFLPQENKKHLTYIGYLTKRKNVLKLLEIVKQLAKLRSDFVLDIVGDGEERERLEAFVKTQNLRDVVTFHGFKQKSELPFYLAQSRCFLFQTDFDIWGLVLNEAMAAGVPCLASIHAGVVVDLIQNGVNGFVVDYNHVPEVVNKMNLFLDDAEYAEKVGKTASQFIFKNAQLHHTISGFWQAINQC